MREDENVDLALCQRRTWTLFAVVRIHAPAVTDPLGA